MAYTKTLIGNITQGAITQRGNKRLQALADKVDDNFTDIETTLSDIVVEGVADVVGSMVTGNTESGGIAVTYDDTDNTLDFAFTLADHDHTAGAGDGGTIPSTSISDFGEAVADAVGAMFTSNTETNVSASYQDDDNTIDLVLGNHTHTAGAGDGGVLSAYPLQFTAATTLTDTGVVVPVDGAGCILTTTVDAGALATATVTTAGSGYQVGDVLTVAGGSGGQVTVATRTGSGVATVTVTTPGTGYSALSNVATTTTTTRAWVGTAMAALTGASTFQQVLQAINDDIAAAAV
jgi:hypothetical protein